MAAERLIYIVDDDDAVRDSLSVLLKARDYIVRAFATAREFLAAAPTLRLGCLIADIRMPEMDGLELQQRLIERQFGFPLIVMTGHGDVPLAVRAMKAGPSISSKSRLPPRQSSKAPKLLWRDLPNPSAETRWRRPRRRG